MQNSNSLQIPIGASDPALEPAVPSPTASGSDRWMPWVVRAVLAGALCIVTGILWDISWHRTIGRDTFWTPAHLAIHAGGLLGGLTGGALILLTTFGRLPDLRARSVAIWGFRGPLGAWVCVWGAIAMLTSAPFDDWWHDTYGLDVKILSPPHMVLALGMWAIVLGAFLLVLRSRNTAADARGATRMLLAAAGILIAMKATVMIERSFPNQQHSAGFLLWSCAGYPVYLMAFSRAARHPWAATIMSAIYMAIFCVMLWILPLFPGQPLLGPIYNPVDRFVPLPFPLLLVVPALAQDLLFRCRWIAPGQRWWRDMILVVLAATSFTVLFVVTQWFFAKFLLSPGAENAFFAGDRHWGYTERPGDWQKRFWDPVDPAGNRAAFLGTLVRAWLLALLSARIGLWVGNWMTRVRR